ncbi:MAG: MBL fold metallo-hydrolase [Candidatus Omnitrophota bacterium]
MRVQHPRLAPIFGLCIVVSAFFFAICSNVFCAPDAIEIHFIDVDEGEATLVRTPTGNSILIDTGNLITGLRVVNYLRSNKIESIDALFLTHPHADHIGGTFFVMQMISVDHVFDNGQELSDSDMLRWYSKLARAHGNYTALNKGGIFTLDGVTFRALWPADGAASNKWNDNSLVLMLEFGEFRCLFTADISQGVEKGLLERGVPLKADILKVGHHGYADATSKEFLKAVDPEIAVIFAKEDTPHGKLSRTVPRRLAQMKIETLRTDINGTIIIVADSKGKLSIAN